MNNFLNESFSEDFSKQFLQNSFYAAPEDTCIYINDALIGNAVVTNIEENNSKIPIYSYNSSTYNKFLQGKKIISGVIALRKTTVASMIKMFAETSESDETDEKLKEIEQISGGENIKAFYKDLIYNSVNNSNLEISDTNIVNFDSSNDLLYKKYNENDSVTIIFYNNVTKGSPLSDRKNSPNIKISNVLFTKKQTEVNIDKNDIIEVYQFIGNPEN